MNIIKINTDTLREDKEGHEDSFCYVLEEIDEVGISVGDEEDEGVFSDQFFCQLYHQDGLTTRISEYRRNRPSY